MTRFCRPKAINTQLEPRNYTRKTTYPDVELARVNSVVMAVESLHVLARPDVPHCHGFVTTTTDKGLRVRQELN